MARWPVDCLRRKAYSEQYNANFPVAGVCRALNDQTTRASMAKSRILDDLLAGMIAVCVLKPDMRWLRKLLNSSVLDLTFCRGDMNLSNMFTKCVGQALFQRFREALGFIVNDLRLSVIVSKRSMDLDALVSTFVLQCARLTNKDTVRLR